MKKIIKYFTPWEIFLWCSSVVLIVSSFLIFDREGYETLIASLIGVTALIFIAKGNPFGQVLMIVFCILYGIISFSFAYYGEMITYVFMSLPMCIYVLITWLKNPYKGNKSEVAVNKLQLKDVVLLCILAIPVTALLYFILAYFNTANLIPSTISVVTSFVAAFLSSRRSPYFALAYAVNDVVLIILWTLAAFVDISYLSVIVCFVVFLANDLYSYYNWCRMRKRQKD